MVAGRLVFWGCAALGAFVVYVWISAGSGGDPPVTGERNDERRIVNIAGEETPVQRRSLPNRTDPAPGKRGGLAYEDTVDSFVHHYRETIDKANFLVHELVMQSRGADRMSSAEVERFGALLADMDDAPGFEGIGTPPEGYEDCGEYLRVGADSLDLAADSLRGFNETADPEYLQDYQALIGWYLQATSDARTCVADRLYPSYP